MAALSTTTRKRVQRPRPQSAKDVARRCVVLLAVVASGHNDRRSKLVPWLRNEGLLDHASPEELRILRARTLSQRDKAYATWRIEAILPLLWALGRFTKMPPPTEKDSSIRGLMPLPLEPTAEFIAKAKLRSVRALRNEQDLVYNIHAHLRSDRMNKKRPPRNIDPEVIQERHYAMNWLLNDEDQPWDDVATDT
jgi:hypothetical protein